MWTKVLHNSLKATAIDVGSMYISMGSSAVNSLTNEYISNGIAAEVRNLWEEVGMVHANRTWRKMQQNERKELPGLGYSARWTSDILAQLQIFLVEKILFKAAETTKQMLLKVIGEGIEKGWGEDRIVSEMENYPGLKYQAARIARTEVNRASNIGIQVAAGESKFEQTKEWLSIHDKRTRGVDSNDKNDHLRLDGIVVDLNDKFIDPRSHEPITHPGDPKAEAGATINCRCTLIIKAKRDEHGRLIRKNGLPVGKAITIVREDTISDVLAKLEKIASSVKNIDIPETDLTKIEDNVKSIEKKLLTKGDVDESVGIIDDVKNELVQLINYRFAVNENSISALIESKEYAPNIVVNSNVELVLDQIAISKNELMKEITKRLDKIMAEVSKKGKWKFDIVKDTNNLITSATAIEI